MIYREDDWKAEVEIFVDNSNEDYHKYSLRVVRTIRASKIYEPTPDGTIFDVDKLKDIPLESNLHRTWSLRGT